MFSVGDTYKSTHSAELVQRTLFTELLIPFHEKT